MERRELLRNAMTGCIAAMLLRSLDTSAIPGEAENALKLGVKGKRLS
jgi:hypothetical protein